jgi:hypothetical protein
MAFMAVYGGLGDSQQGGLRAASAVIDDFEFYV